MLTVGKTGLVQNVRLSTHNLHVFSPQFYHLLKQQQMNPVPLIPKSADCQARQHRLLQFFSRQELTLISCVSESAVSSIREGQS